MTYDVETAGCYEAKKFCEEEQRGNWNEDLEFCM